MTGTNSRLLEANGLRFALDEAGSGNSIALFLHGFPQSRLTWRHQLEPMAELGWRAVAVDMRGYGQSSRPSEREAYHIDHLVADVAALFDALGAERRLLIGHDWGGMVAWAAAIRRVGPLEGLVIINAPHPRVYRAVMRRSWRQRLRSAYILFFALPWLPEKLMSADHAREVGAILQRTSSSSRTFPPDVLHRYRENAAQGGAMTAMLNYYRANLGLADIGRGPGVDVPTLLLWGDRDVALGTELVAGTAMHVPDLTIEVLEGISHWVPEEAPDQVNSAIRDWLGKSVAPSK